MSALSEEVTQVKEEGISKIQNEKLSKIPMPAAWHVKSGTLEWLDEGLGERVLLLEKSVAQNVRSIEKESAEQKISLENGSSEKSKNASRNRQLYRIALYNGRLMKDRTGKEITGQTLVLFFRPNYRVSKQWKFSECQRRLFDDNFNGQEYRTCYSGVNHISDKSVPSVHFLMKLRSHDGNFS